MLGIILSTVLDLSTLMHCIVFYRLPFIQWLAKGGKKIEVRHRAEK